MKNKTIIALSFINQGNKAVQRLKHGLEHYNMHHAIFRGYLAIGNNAVSSIDPYLRLGKDLDDCDSSTDKEIDATTMDTGPHFGDKRVISSWGRKCK